MSRKWGTTAWVKGYWDTFQNDKEVRKSTHSTHVAIHTENAEARKKWTLFLEDCLSCWVCLTLDSRKQGKPEILVDKLLSIVWQWIAILDFLLRNEKGNKKCWLQKVDFQRTLKDRQLRHWCSMLWMELNLDQSNWNDVGQVLFVCLFVF